MTATILLVEDEKIIQIVMKAMLERLNYQFDLATTGQEALEKAQTKKYDLILTDIGLPDIRGTEVASKIRDSVLNDKTSIVALTGFAIDDVEGECHAAGVKAIYNKPMNIETLKDIIKTYTKQNTFLH